MDRSFAVTGVVEVLDGVEVVEVLEMRGVEVVEGIASEVRFLGAIFVCFCIGFVVVDGDGFDMGL